MEYKVIIRETLEAEFETEADNSCDAIANAMEAYYSCDIVLGSEHFIKVDFLVKGEEK